MLRFSQWWLIPLLLVIATTFGTGCARTLPAALCMVSGGEGCPEALPEAPIMPAGGLPQVGAGPGAGVGGLTGGHCPQGGCAPLQPEYRIGSGDELLVSVWRNEDLSVRAPVRPDGMISLPLIGDVRAASKTPEELSDEIAFALVDVVDRPQVSVIVTGFVGNLAHKIRVVGEAAQPMALTYRHDMTVLDVMIAVGGLTRFADGNRTILVRGEKGKQQTSYRVRLDDLLLDGDTSANAYMLPGDILIIPETLF